MVANAPFGITTDIVRWCLDARTLTSATLVTQVEFAGNHTGDYGCWSKLTESSAQLLPDRRCDRSSEFPRAAGPTRRSRPAPRPEPRPAAEEDSIDDRDLVELGFSGVSAARRPRHPRRVVSVRVEAGPAPRPGLPGTRRADSVPVGIRLIPSP